MALVDYSSSESADEDGDGPPPNKRRRAATGSVDGAAADGQPDGKAVDGEAVDGETHGSDHVDGLRSKSSSKGKDSTMPPLPTAFHDLYASSVRQSVADDPSLHHGRKRQTPHVAGNWPTHLYVEWHPTTEQHSLLTALVGDIEAMMGEDMELHNFLTSDLGSPLPLHISLSRPITLTTAYKEDFLNKITASMTESGAPAFNVSPMGLAWYKSPDSDRTFLIVRVTSDAPTGKRGKVAVQAANPELMGLLKRCNTVATAFNQPALYQRTQKEHVGNAFHVSIGWTFGLPGDELSLKVLKLFKLKKFAELRRWKIEVAGVKVKIGNVVSHVALTGGKGTRASVYEP